MTGEPPYARRDDLQTDPPVAGPAGPGPGGPSTQFDPAERHSGSLGTADRPELKVERTRTGGLWVAAIAAAVAVLLLLIFILQNTEQVEVSLFGANPDLPLGVALLLAAVLGALVVALIGTARIIQLRLLARRHRGADRAVDRGSRH
jgi:uncharacterized integral membrane protein